MSEFFIVISLEFIGEGKGGILGIIRNEIRNIT